MRKKLDQGLEKLQELVTTQYTCANELLEMIDYGKAGVNPASVLTLEQKQKECYEEADRLAIRLLMRQQPVASDLKMLSLYQRVSVHLNRIMHQAKEESMLAQSIFADEWIGKLESMKQLLCRMLRLSMEAIETASCTQAREVRKMDDEMDAAFETIRQALSSISEAERAEELVNVLMSAKYLERMADHASKISKDLLHFEDELFI